jgi:hypothetical protein
MPKRTDLAAAVIHREAKLRVQLVEPNGGKPPLIAIDWPPVPTVCTPQQLDAVVAAAMRVLSNAVVELAALRASGRKLS